MGQITDCMVFRWLLCAEKAEQLDQLGKQVYEQVLTQTTPTKTKAASADSAMGHMVAARTSAKAAKVSKQAAATMAATPSKTAKEQTRA